MGTTLPMVTKQCMTLATMCKHCSQFGTTGKLTIWRTQMCLEAW